MGIERRLLCELCDAISFQKAPDYTLEDLERISRPNFGWKFPPPGRAQGSHNIPTMAAALAVWLCWIKQIPLPVWLSTWWSRWCSSMIGDEPTLIRGGCTVQPTLGYEWFSRLKNPWSISSAASASTILGLLHADLRDEIQEVVALYIRHLWLASIPQPNSGHVGRHGLWWHGPSVCFAGPRSPANTWDAWAGEMLLGSTCRNPSNYGYSRPLRKLGSPATGIDLSVAASVWLMGDESGDRQSMFPTELLLHPTEPTFLSRIAKRCSGSEYRWPGSWRLIRTDKYVLSILQSNPNPYSEPLYVSMLSTEVNKDGIASDKLNGPKLVKDVRAWKPGHALLCGSGGTPSVVRVMSQKWNYKEYDAITVPESTNVLLDFVCDEDGSRYKLNGMMED